jgi:hypothetical protein
VIGERVTELLDIPAILRSADLGSNPGALRTGVAAKVAEAAN